MRKNCATLVIGAAVSVALFNISAAAVVTAWDDASQSAYSSGWSNGSNGGFGFGAWTINDNGGGHFIGNSANNGNGTATPNINTGANKAFGLYSGPTDGVTEAYRGITTPLPVGQTFTISIDNGYLNSGGGNAVGVGLQTSSGVNRFEFYFNGGNYKYRDASGEQDSGISYTEGGLRINFTLLSGGNNADVRITKLSDNAVTAFPNLSLASSGSIARVRAFNYRAGSGSTNDFFVNGMTVPEPTTFSVLTGGVLLASLKRKRN